jgi:hypothetical protein
LWLLRYRLRFYHHSKRSTLLHSLKSSEDEVSSRIPHLSYAELIGIRETHGPSAASGNDSGLMISSRLQQRWRPV